MRLRTTTAPTFTLIGEVELRECDTLIAAATVPTGRDFDTYEEVVDYATTTYGLDIAGYLAGADEDGNLLLEDSIGCEPAEWSDDQAESFADDLPSFGVDITWMITHFETDEDLATVTTH